MFIAVVMNDTWWQSVWIFQLLDSYHSTVPCPGDANTGCYVIKYMSSQGMQISYPVTVNQQTERHPRKCLAFCQEAPKTLRWRKGGNNCRNREGKEEEVKTNKHTHTRTHTNIKWVPAMFSLLSPKDVLLAEARCLSPWQIQVRRNGSILPLRRNWERQLASGVRQELYSPGERRKLPWSENMDEWCFGSTGLHTTLSHITPVVTE